MIDDEARRDALDVLHDALEWEATPQQWGRIDRALSRLREAFDADDDTAARRATADLEYLGVHRGNDAGTDSGTTATPVIRERLNDTIHKVGK